MQLHNIMIDQEKEEFTCGICYCDYKVDASQGTNDEYSRKMMLSGCGHVFCQDCFKEFYRTLIEDQMKSHDLKCPQYGCDNKPTEEEIRNIITPKSFGIFQKQ